MAQRLLVYPGLHSNFLPLPFPQLKSPKKHQRGEIFFYSFRKRKPQMALVFCLEKRKNKSHYMAKHLLIAPMLSLLSSYLSLLLPHWACIFKQLKCTCFASMQHYPIHNINGSETESRN